MSNRVSSLEGSLNENIYRGAVDVSKVTERGMAAFCEEVALGVKARAEGAF